ncbi:MAG TPA: dihydroorotate dehydrogenase (quinone) [Flavobacteriales bacterium]|nr:dihydroorotate dehydrogenase (quinone) [Flavobacteriales bacterium]
MYQRILKPLLFLLSPEKAHTFAVVFLKLSALFPMNLIVRSVFKNNNKTPYTCMGIQFPSRLGLAAGFDKDAEMFDGLLNFGFGFVEIGTITPKPQGGNEKPRLFRLPVDKGLINRMGFNNQGVESAVNRLKKRKRNAVIGGNIGKNKITPNDEAFLDYERCFEELFEYVDYFTVNVSSPNTPGLRSLQDKEPLKKLLQHLQDLNNTHGSIKPILLKIAPDLSRNQLDEVVEIVLETKIAGIIACNTTIERSGLLTPSDAVEQIGPGGLSGSPLKKKALEVVSYLSEKSKGAFTIVGVGGISTAQDALDMIRAGADLIQVYTGFIYEGPIMVKKINEALNLNSN